MLTRFAVTNYRGFLKTIVLDLSNPKNYEFNASAIQDGVIKNAIIYGANGCGKTNLSLAIFDIVNHLSQKWKKPDYYDNFVSAGSLVKDVDFEYSFKLGSDKLQYDYSKNARGLLTKERLEVNGKKIFSKNADEFQLSSAEFKLNDSVKAGIQKNANSLSIINFLLSSFPFDKDHYLVRLRDFVSSMLWFRCLEQREFIGLETTAYLLDDYIISNSLVGEFSSFLEKISGQHFDFAPSTPDEKRLLCKMNGALVPFNAIASTGTHALTLLFFWIKHLKDASFVFIDEFDAFYHFKLSYEVCKLLFSSSCQVLLSSHNTYLMTNDLLRPDCNLVIHDNEIKPLSDCTDKELRFGHNIEKLFRGGTFDR
ncbi:MAG: AAA family ATPase [Sphaerochaetaceae bacterium]|jgi:AAA15 family ATPase/GTPase|nr:AAA family ATPase [Sphaerochaetaceae bacterium]